eukprot:TRINITY_DN13735_c0_g4_i1.p1 TRINITY_DN13735_c0_g4~~TRINITY_DN13735_c0_g4_i1.p1  ORF type:complete len:864 (-),score=194.60 TRINITY_DN13735_c0_g4_i1:70-2661(-)
MASLAAPAAPARALGNKRASATHLAPPPPTTKPVRPKQAAKREVPVYRPPEPCEREWELVLADTRRVGQKLQVAGGSDPKAVKTLLNVFKDGRAAKEGALRRTVIEALKPAAALGHRGALSAQAKALTDPNEAVRKVATDALKAAAFDVRPERGGAVAVALGEVLPPRAARHDVRLRRTASEAMLHLAPKADMEMVKLATQWSKDEDASVRLSATRALCDIGNTVDEINTVAERLTDSDWRVSRQAIRSLESLGSTLQRPRAMSASESSAPDSEGSTSRLTRRRRSSVSNMSRRRSSAASSLRRGSRALGPMELLELQNMGPPEDEGPEPKELATTLMADICSGENSKLLGLPRVEATAALGRLAVAAGHENADTDVLPEALLAASSRLVDVDYYVRREAVQAIAAMAHIDRGAAASAAYDGLDHEDYRMRAAAREALCTSLSAANDHGLCAKVLKLLEVEDWRKRRGVGPTLRQLGLQHYGLEHIRKYVEPMLMHPDWSVRRKVIEAYAHLAQGFGGDKKAVRFMGALAWDPDDEVRLTVASMLPIAAPAKSKEAIAILTTMATADPYLDVRTCAVESIGVLASEGRSKSRAAIWGISTCLEDDHEDVRARAAWTLQRVGYGRRCAIDGLANRLHHRNPSVRQAAIESFSGVLGPTPSERSRERIYLRLVPNLQHSDPLVREASTEAIAAFAAPPKEEAPADGAPQGPDPIAVIQAGAAVMARYRQYLEGDVGGGLTPEESEVDAQSVGGMSRASRTSRTSLKSKGPQSPQHEQKTAGERASIRASQGSDDNILSMLLAGNFDVGKETRTKELTVEEPEEEEADPWDVPEHEFSESETDEDEEENAGDEEDAQTGVQQDFRL